MPEPENYARPPITEAVIEIRTVNKLSEDDLERASKKIKQIYPNLKQLQSRHFEINPTGDADAIKVEVRNDGFRLSTDDETGVILTRKNAIAAARLAPYTNWEDLIERIKVVWEKWLRFAPNPVIARLGVRYLNRIDVSTANGAVDPHDYLTYLPNAPDCCKGVPTTFTCQIVIPTRKAGWRAAIASAMVNPPPLVAHDSYLLDIDVFRDGNVEGGEDALWQTIAEARELKNEIFESCITDQSRALFRQ